MLKWYDYLMVCMLAWPMSQGIMYNFFWAFIAWIAFVNYMAHRRDGRV